MPGSGCINCRWWGGSPDANDRVFEKDRHGACERFSSSRGLREDTPLRIYPTGADAWIDTRFDFSCLAWEKRAGA